MEELRAAGGGTFGKHGREIRATHVQRGGHLRNSNNRSLTSQDAEIGKLAWESDRTLLFGIVPTYTRAAMGFSSMTIFYAYTPRILASQPQSSEARDYTSHDNVISTLKVVG